MTRYNILFAISALIASNSRYQFAAAIFRTTEVGSSDYTFEEVHDLVTDTSRSLLTNQKILENLDICGGWELIANQIPDGENSCVCRDNIVQCTLQGQCNVDRSVCTDVVGMSFQFLVNNKLQKANRMKLSACFSYSQEFQPTCIETLVAPGQRLMQCNSATYGGKQCLCAICSDKKSLAIDCTKHHPSATSNGCYRLSDALPALAKFDEAPQQGRRRTAQEEASGGTFALRSLFVVTFLVFSSTLSLFV